MQTVSTYHIRSFSCYWAQLLAAQANIFSMFYKSDHTAHCFHRPTADYNWSNLLTSMRYLGQFLRMNAGVENHNENKNMSRQSMELIWKCKEATVCSLTGKTELSSTV